MTTTRTTEIALHGLGDRPHGGADAAATIWQRGEQQLVGRHAELRTRAANLAGLVVPGIHRVLDGVVGLPARVGRGLAKLHDRPERVVQRLWQQLAPRAHVDGNGRRGRYERERAVLLAALVVCLVAALVAALAATCVDELLALRVGFRLGRLLERRSLTIQPTSELPQHSRAAAGDVASPPHEVFQLRLVDS
ncbi:hypothetical protein OAO87_02135 [bacterium]|nr:hypothetical protein [bacterium]